MLINKNLLMLTLLVFSMQAKSEWLLVGSNDVHKFYVETESIRKAPPFITYWEKRNHTPPVIYSESTRKTYSSRVSKVQGDCYNMKYMTLSATFYSGFDQKGEVLGTDELFKSNIAQWDDLIPGSLGELSLKYACSKTK